MASLALLSAVPLLSATSSVTFTLCEDTFIRPLMYTGTLVSDVELRHYANRILPGQGRFIRRGLPIVFITYPLSIATAAANAARHDGRVDIYGDNDARLAAGFFLAGLAFSLLHFVFGQKAVALLKQVRENKGIDGDPVADNTAMMSSWLRINAIRGLVADVPSWACYFSAFLLAMR